MSTVTGRCLCEKVRFEVRGPIGPAVLCHCTMCQRASGSAFATNASVRRDYVRFVEGEDTIREFESSRAKWRGFCSACGTPLYSRQDARPGVIRLRFGTLAGDPAVRPVAHIWVSSKAPWFEITDTLPRFEREPPAEMLAPA